MRKDERAPLGLALAVVAIALVGASYATPWWSFEESTGRQNAPEGPVDDAAVERHSIEFYADHSEGDIPPADIDRSDRAMWTIQIAVITAVAAMGLYVLGQMPRVARIITRPWCMALGTIATIAVTVALVAGWAQLPASMAPKGVEGPFTSLLLDDGYIRSQLEMGWALAAFAAVAALGTVLSAYSAGNADPRVIEEYRVA